MQVFGCFKPHMRNESDKVGFLYWMHHRPVRKLFQVKDLSKSIFVGTRKMVRRPSTSPQLTLKVAPFRTTSSPIRPDRITEARVCPAPRLVAEF